MAADPAAERAAERAATQKAGQAAGPSADVLVVGALHWDTIVGAPRLPALDETLPGGGVSYALGGKGANQAVAAAQHGAQVAMAGCVGADPAGTAMLAALDAAGVQRGQVRVVPGASGMSVAIVGETGGYGAVIVSAANLWIEADRIAFPPGCRILLLQNEIPEPANLALARRARAAGLRVVLNAAPARAIGVLIGAVDLLVVNRVEAASLTGMDDPKAALARLADGCATLITLGAVGLIWQDGAASGALPALPVTPISTHGAGDAFLGALAARLARDDPFAEACAYANAAASLHVATPPDRRAALTPADVKSQMGARPPASPG
ncbi:MAG: PfkB family carbohydrate kinase [Pseudomonadota bacterium]